MRVTSLSVLAVLLGIWPGSPRGEPLVSVNNFLTSDAVFNVQVDPLDAAGKPISALHKSVVWTFQQQSIQTTFPASPTPYTFTGLHVWYRVESGTGIAAFQWGGFDHVQAPKQIPAGITLSCVYSAPPIGLGDVTCTPGPDTVPPSPPGSLAAVSPSTSTVNLTWSQAQDNVGVAKYSIERCPGVGCTSFAPVGASTVLAFGDSALASGSAYNYRVSAADVAGNLSSYSNVAAVTVLAPVPPPLPPPVACVRIPPVTPVTGEVTDFSAKIVDGAGATWTIAPRVQPGDTVPGQVTLKRNGVQQFGGIEYAYRKGTGQVCVADFKSGPGVSCYVAPGWVPVAGPAAC